MSADINVKTIAQVYEAFGRGDVAAILDAVTDDVDWAATAPATGKSVAMDIHHWWRFRDGKICFYRGTEDTARTQALLRKD